MGKHTSEPWKMAERQRVFFPQGIHANSDPREDYYGSIVIADTYGDMVAVATGMRDDEPNASRIVACVNACEGISDPSAVKELVEACFRLFYPGREAESKAEILGILNRMKGTP